MPARGDGSLHFDTSINGKGFDDGVKKLQVAATAALAAIGAAVGACAVAVVKFGSEFETGMAKVSTMVTGTADVCSARLDQISDSLLNTSNATGKSAASLAEAAYQALSASVAVEDVGAYVDKAAKLAIGGFTTTESAVDVLSSVINAYGADVIDVDAASKILMQTQNKGKTTIDELSRSLAQCTPTAAAMGVSFEQVGAALATMTAQGIPTAQSTTQLNQLMAELGKSGTTAADNLAKAADGTEYAGKTFSQLMAEGVPLSDLLLLMSGYAEQNGTALLDMFSSIEAGKAALSLVNGAGKTFTDNLAAMSTGADVVGAAYGKMMDTFAAKKDVFIESAKNLAIAAYQQIEKPLKDVTDAGIKLVQQASKAVTQNGGKILDVVQDIAKAAAVLLSGLIAFKAVAAVSAVVMALSKSFAATSIVLKGYTAAIAASSAMSARGISVELLLASTLKTKEILIGALTGKIGLATAAQTLWNAAITANPVGLVAVAVAALVGGVVALTLAMDDNKSAAETELALARERNAVMQQQAADYEQAKANRYDSIKADISSIDNTRNLTRELMGLADSNGYVHEQDRTRAAFILGELNRALGTEYQMTNGLIGQYDGLCASVEQLIATKRAEILLGAQEEGYREAILQVKAAEEERASAKIQMAQAQADVDALEAQHIQELTNLEAIRALGASASIDQQRAAGLIQMQGWYEELNTRRATLEEQSAAYQTADAQVDKYYSDIATYETSAGLIANQETQKAIDLMEQKNVAYLNGSAVAAAASEEEEQAVGEKYANILMQLADHIEKYNAGMEGYTLAGVQSLQEAASQCGAEAQRVGASIVDGQITGIDGKKIPLNDVIRSLSDGALQVAKNKAPEFTPIGKQMAAGVESGIRNGKSGAVNAAVELVRAAIEAANKEADINSPSKVTTRTGEYMGDGVAVGMTNKTKDVQAASAKMMEAAIPPTPSERIHNIAAAFATRMQSAMQTAQMTISAAVTANPSPAYAGIASSAAPTSSTPTKTINLGGVTLYAAPGASESEMTRVLGDYVARCEWGLP